jgi:hypothetical protein
MPRARGDPGLVDPHERSAVDPRQRETAEGGSLAWLRPGAAGALR